MVDAMDNRWIARAREVATETLARHADDVDRTGRWPDESVQALGQAGLLGLTVDCSYGGPAAGPQVFAAVTCLLAEQCASTAMIYLMHCCAIQVIAASSAFPCRDSVLAEIVAGRHLSTLAFSEKGSRSHFWAPVSQPVATGNTYRLTAHKSWVTSAGHADSYIVSTRAAGSIEPLASTIFYLARDTPGIGIGPRWNGLGLRGNDSSPIDLVDVPLSAANLLSEEGEGFTTMLSTVLPWFQLGSAAVAIGIARAATLGTRQHLLTTNLEHTGQALATLPNLRTRLARMQILVDSHQTFLEHVATSMATPGPDTMLTVLESKAAATEMALEVTDLAMRSCGGAAFSRHLAVERNFRDARAGSVMAPTTDVLYDFIGKTILGLPLF
jgi:alkylation response protein AidB-like acyl-CoA dehydrogenase